MSYSSFSSRFQKLGRRAFFAVSFFALFAGANAVFAADNAPVSPPKPMPGVNHVLLIGLDGFGSYAWEKAEMPRLKSLAAEGAMTLEARTVLPSVSGPNWGAHLMGAGPEFHGFTNNDPKPKLTPLVRNERGLFPGIFPLVREGYPKATTAAFYDWGRIHDLIDYTTVTEEKNGKKADVTVKMATQYIVAKKPLFTFVHLDTADHAGHSEGHDTPAYYEALKELDADIGKLLDAVKAAGIAKETVVIVVSDHGGVKKGHGGIAPTEVRTPWIIAGPGVKCGHVIKSAVVHFDTSPTVAHVLGLQLPQAWRGLPVREAFQQK